MARIEGIVFGEAIISTLTDSVEDKNKDFVEDINPGRKKLQQIKEILNQKLHASNTRRNGVLSVLMHCLHLDIRAMQCLLNTWNSLWMPDSLGR